MASPSTDKKNLKILTAEIGEFKHGEIVPAYALAQAHPDILVERKLCEWTNEPATVTVSTESLAAAAPDTSSSLIKAHSALMADHKEALEQIDILHKKGLDLESTVKALTAELSQKVQDIDTYKGQRDKALLEIEQLKTILETEKTKTPAAPPANQQTTPPATPPKP